MTRIREKKTACSWFSSSLVALLAFCLAIAIVPIPLAIAEDVDEATAAEHVEAVVNDEAAEELGEPEETLVPEELSNVDEAVSPEEPVNPDEAGVPGEPVDPDEPDVPEAETGDAALTAAVWMAVLGAASLAAALLLELGRFVTGQDAGRCARSRSVRAPRQW